MQGLQPIFERVLASRKLILIYGPAATGKTHLAYYLYRLMKQKGHRSILIATEPGTITFLVNIGEDDYLRALTIDELATIATKAALQGYMLFIDSVNWHYRENPTMESARILAYTVSLASRVGGLVIAQVSGEDARPSGARFITPWAHMVVETSKIGENLFQASVKRPISRLAIFKVRGARVQWL